MKFLDANHIAAQVPSPNAFEPQRTNNFTIQFIPPAAAGVANAQDIIALTLKSFPMPKETSEEIDVWFGNEKRSVTGRTTWDNETLVANDYVDTTIADVMVAWRKQCYDPATGKVGWARNYKISGDVLMFGPDGTTIRTWELRGLWPKEVQYGKGTMERAEHNTIEVVFKVDKIVYLGRQLNAVVSA